MKINKKIDKIITGLFFSVLLLFFPSCPQTNILAKFLTDGIPPQILSISPEEGEILVALDTPVTLTFSEAMDRSSIERALSLNPGTVSGTFSWSPDDKQLVFTPTNLLEKMTIYTIIITTDAMDKNNVSLENAATSSFTTRTTSKIAGGSNYSAALKMDGTVWCWGDNSYMQLGNNTNNPSTSPIQVSGLAGVTEISIYSRSNQNIVLLSDHTMKLWGRNNYHQLGIGDSTTSEGLPIPVVDINAVAANITSIAGGGYHTMALNSNGQVLAWGINNTSQLGLIGTSAEYYPVALPSFTSNIAKVFCGYASSAAVTSIASGGKLWMWGMNTSGQLGSLSDPVTTPTEVTLLQGPVTELSCSQDFTVAIIQEGENYNVYTWGLNGTGELGRTPVAGENYIPGKVDLQDNNVSKIATGYHHVLVLTVNGVLYGWGDNQFAQLGKTATAPGTKNSPEKILIEDVVDIAAGANHSMALKSDGTVWTWGLNTASQLGRTNTEVIIDKVPGLNLNQ